MRKLVFCLLIVASVSSVFAQEKGKIRVGLNAGLMIPKSGVGFDGDLDVRYNIMDNINVGVRFSSSFGFKDLIYSSLDNTANMNMSFIGSTVLMSDYYFNKGESSFAPFLGGGLGLYRVLNINATATEGTQTTYTNSDIQSMVFDKRLGLLLRGGFEAGHFRMTLEYNLVPRSSVVDITNVNLGTTGNSFLAAKIGFYLGGGKWRKLSR